MRDIKKKDIKRNNKGMNFLFSNTKIFSVVKAMYTFYFYAKSFLYKRTAVVAIVCDDICSYVDKFHP